MNPERTFNLPPAASTLAHLVDGPFYFVYWASVIFFFIIVIGTLFFVLRYRKKSGETSKLTSGFSHNLALELIWSVIPAMIFMGMFVWGARAYLQMFVIPANAMEIQVTGQQWSWLFTYPGGAKSEKLVVPKGRPVKMRLSSRDVIHSFFVPDFRVKMDALPNRYSSLWFQSDHLGEYDYYCTEYCGQQHSRMTGTLNVVSSADFERWIDDISVTPTGDVLYKRYGCVTCHSTDGSPGNAPTFKGLFGRQERLSDGSSIDVDENYLRESILEPKAKVVQGYESNMPTFQNVVSHDELDALINFIKSLSSSGNE